MYRFKLYKERDIPGLNTPLAGKDLSKPSCDNDCPTEMEQVASSKKFLNKELMKAVEEYKKDSKIVKNAGKYKTILV